MPADAKKLGVILLTGTWAFAGAVDIAVPNELEHTEGNSFELFPFLINQTGIPSMRYQQVYDASQFSALGTQGGYLTAILFRADGEAEAASAFITNIQINFCATSKGPDNMSPVFSENVGADDTVVLRPASLRISGDGGSIPNYWGVQIPLTTPFWYDPGRGNLLLDVRIYGDGVPVIARVSLDAQSVTNDSMSRLYAESIDATVATQVDSLGLVTYFQFRPVPTLQIQETTNSIVITWPVQPQNFLLYWTDKLATNDTFQLFGGETGGDSVYYQVSLPVDSLGPARFFRLLCSKCASVSSPALRQRHGQAGKSAGLTTKANQKLIELWQTR